MPQAQPCILAPSAEALIGALAEIRATVLPLVLLLQSTTLTPLQQAQGQRRQECILGWVCWGQSRAVQSLAVSQTLQLHLLLTHVNTGGISLPGNLSFCAMVEHNKNLQEARQVLPQFHYLSPKCNPNIQHIPI